MLETLVLGRGLCLISELENGAVFVVGGSGLGFEVFETEFLGVRGGVVPLLRGGEDRSRTELEIDFARLRKKLEVDDLIPPPPLPLPLELEEDPEAVACIGGGMSANGNGIVFFVGVVLGDGFSGEETLTVGVDPEESPEDTCGMGGGWEPELEPDDNGEAEIGDGEAGDCEDVEPRLRERGLNLDDMVCSLDDCECGGLRERRKDLRRRHIYKGAIPLLLSPLNVFAT